MQQAGPARHSPFRRRSPDTGRADQGRSGRGAQPPCCGWVHGYRLPRPVQRPRPHPHVRRYRARSPPPRRMARRGAPHRQRGGPADGLNRDRPPPYRRPFINLAISVMAAVSADRMLSSSIECPAGDTTRTLEPVHLEARAYEVSGGHKRS